MDVDLERLELLSEEETLDKRLSESADKIADLKDHYEKLLGRFTSIKSQGSTTTAVPTSEALIALLRPAAPSLSPLSLYDTYEPTRFTERCTSYTPTETPDSEVEAEAERQREEWRNSLDSTDRAILCGVAPQLQEDSKENIMNVNDSKQKVVPNGDIESLSLSKEDKKSYGELTNVGAMDIEFTTEVPQKVLVTPVTDIKRNRRILRSNQTDSTTKRVRRSARF